MCGVVVRWGLVSDGGERIRLGREGGRASSSGAVGSERGWSGRGRRWLAGHRMRGSSLVRGGEGRGRDATPVRHGHGAR